MTKEKLEKEAHEKWWDEDTVSGASTPNRIFVAGYLAGAEPREKQIADLEQKVEIERSSRIALVNKIAELEEKNRELRDCLCNVANNLLDSWCRNEEAYCPHLAKLEKENSELKADNDARKFAMAMSENVEKQLREENAELKEKLKPENCLKLLAKEGYIKFTSDNLTKAIELIKRLMHELVVSNIPYDEVELLVKDVEQFLSEVEK